MKIHVNKQSKGKPENPHRPNSYIWKDFEVGHPELICLTPTGELAGEGSYETDGKVVWQYKLKQGSVPWRNAHKGAYVINDSFESAKAKIADEADLREVYIVTTPANEQPKEENLISAAKRFANIQNEKLPFETSRPIDNFLNGFFIGSEWREKNPVTPAISLKSAYEILNDAISFASLDIKDNDYENIIEVMHDFANRTKVYNRSASDYTPAPSLAPVDESVEERAKKERIIRQCVRAIPRPSMFGDKFNKLYEDSVANDKATHLAMSKYANECLKEHVKEIAELKERITDLRNQIHELEVDNDNLEQELKMRP